MTMDAAGTFKSLVPTRRHMPENRILIHTDVRTSNLQIFIRTLRSVLSQLNPIHNVSVCFFKVHFPIIQERDAVAQVPVPSRFPAKP
jgi:hypothetical protein